MFKGLLYFAILTTATVASWIGSNVYHNYTQTTIADDTSIIITPIPKEFDRAIIERLKMKKVFRPDLGENITETNIITDATPSAQQATGSALQL